MKIRLSTAILIMLLAVLCVYGAVYAYTSESVRHDLGTFKKDLNNIESAKIPESQITQMESLANQIENGTPIEDLPDTQVSKYSKLMKSNFTVFADFGDLNNRTAENEALSTKYYFLLKFDVGNEIKNAYNSKLVDLRNQMVQTQDKAADDFANGDNSAVAADLRQYVQYAKEYNQLINQAKESLEKIVTQLN